MKTRFLITCFAGIILLSAVNVALALETAIPDVIHFNGAVDGGGSADIHPTTYSGPVTFQHKKHFSEYGAGCGNCHHDSDHEPIVGYDDDKSFSCADCHDEEGFIRGPLAENAASPDDLIAHRANVIHMRCIGCHKKNNSERNVIRMPEACRMCHTKRDRDWILE